VVFVVVAFLLTTPIAANADLIIGNDFLWQHEDETQKLERLRFCVVSPDGYINLRVTPGWDGEILEYSNWRMPTYKNGTEIHMEQTYFVNGEYWGIPVIAHYIWDLGWIPMKYLRVLYTGDDFNIEHLDDFYTYTGIFNEITTINKLVVWQWPGSNREKLIIDEKDFTINTNSVRHAYRDAEGREWVYVEIEYTTKYVGWYGGRGLYWNEYAWICLSDPENSKIKAFNHAPKPAVWSPEGNYEWLPDNGFIKYSIPNFDDYFAGAYDWPPKNLSKLLFLLPTTIMPYLIISLAAVLVIGAVVWIKVFRKQNKTKPGGKRDD
jgi:hypothetical protein